MRDDETPNDLRALFDAERAAPIGAPPSARARLRASLITRTGGGGGDDGGNGGPSPNTPPTNMFPSIATLAGASALSLVLGVGIGLWGADREAEREEPAPIVRQRPIETASAPPLVLSVDAGAPALAVSPRRARRATTAREQASASSPGASTAEERALIDRAHAALRRSAWHDALMAVMEHERRFPSGTLVEERDRLAVEALAREGRVEPARRRIERYRREHPDGLHRDAVERIATELSPSQ